MSGSDEVVNTGADGRASPRVMVVDDNDTFRTELRELLRDYDIRVVGEASDGAQAVEMIESLRPDIVLLDLCMPKQDGIETARQIRERRPETQVIILTAYDYPAFRRDAGDIQADAFLVKGMRPESIREAIMGVYGEPQETAPGGPVAAGDTDALERLTAAQIRLHTLRRQTKDPRQLAVIEELDEAVEIGIGGLRDLLFEIRPPELEEGGLAAKIRAMLVRHAAEASFAFEVDNGVTAELPAEVAANAFSIAREALDNVATHSAAANVKISLEEQEGGLFVEVADDGKGLSPGDLSAHTAVGLTSMRERAESAGGWCRIWSLPGAGTTVKFWLPL